MLDFRERSSAMHAKSAATSAPPAPPCPRPASMEITPEEFAHYMCEAHRMRADTTAVFVAAGWAALARLAGRAAAALRPRTPAKTMRSRAA
jgi:hypothetical protein